MQQKPQLILKTVFVGQANAGKTSLLQRQTRNNFTQEFVATIGVDFRVKDYQVGGVKARMQYWDTAGQQRFRSIQKPYYRSASSVCLCFDLSDKNSFDHLPHWVDEIKENKVQGTVFLIGCKSDCDTQVPTDQILAFAEAYHLKYFQTSAKHNEGVNEGFKYMVETVVRQKIQKLAFENLKKQFIPIPINKMQEKSKKKVCC